MYLIKYPILVIALGKATMLVWLWRVSECQVFHLCRRLKNVRTQYLLFSRR